MMVSSKNIFQALSAVVLGFVLISVVPSMFGSFQREEFMIEVSNREFHSSEDGSVEKSIPVSTESRVSNVFFEGALTLGIWVVDLIIALSIYFIVKRIL